MNSSLFFRFAVCLLALSAAFLFAPAAEALTPAPPGTYSATLGATTVKGARQSAQKGEGHFQRKFPAPAEGQTITIHVASYSSDEELRELRAAQNDPQAFIDVLGRFEHGFVQVGEKKVPINFAISNKAGNYYGIQLLSSKPFSEAGPEGKMMKVTRTGYIRMTVDEQGNGTGTLYRTAGTVNLNNSGDVDAQAGMMHTTELKDIHRQ